MKASPGRTRASLVACAVLLLLGSCAPPVYPPSAEAESGGGVGAVFSTGGPIEQLSGSDRSAYDFLLAAKTLPELWRRILEHDPRVDVFRGRGPFAVTVAQNHQLRLSKTEVVSADLYLPAPAGRAPLVMFVHGHDSSRRAHTNQAIHLASWGMNALTVQVPNKGPWIGNGRTLARVVRPIQRSPDLLDPRIDPARVILVGHSFGAFAVAVALGEGITSAGAILLDPAVPGKIPPKLLQRITRPVIVVGADEAVSPARNRDFFYEYIRGRISEVSIKDAAHEDAQYPSDHALQNGGFDPNTTEELQITFVSAITAAAMSVAHTGDFDWAWRSFNASFANGKLIEPKRK